MEALWQDLRLGLRTLARSPGFTAAAMLTLSLGIGANAAVFSIAYGVLQRPLPYPDASSLILIGAQRDFAGERRAATFSAPDIVEWRQRSRTLASLAGYAPAEHALRGKDVVEPVEGVFVSESFFSTLGQPPASGRLLGSGDDGSSVAVISHGLSSRFFQGSKAAVGSTLTLSERSYTVVGVAAPDFHFPSERVDVWTPMGQARQSGLAPWLGQSRGGGVRFVARLQPGVTVTAARADLATVGRALAHERALADGAPPVVTRVADSIVGGVRPALHLLLGAVALVLFVSSANVANLLMARHATRKHQIAIRLALGATRGRIIAHAMAESAILGTGGCLLGILLAVGIVQTLVWLEPAHLPRLDAVQVDAPVLAFAAAVAAAATLGAGLGPAILALGKGTPLGLGTTAGYAGSAMAGRLRFALIVAELAVSGLLLVGSSVLARSFVRLLHQDIGAKTAQVVVARLNLSLGRHLPEDRQRALAAELVESVKALPGVELAALASALPPNGRMLEVTLKDLPTARGRAPEYAINAAPATADFFATLGIPLREGRVFNPSDDLFHERVLILSADAARDLFAGDPIGRTLMLPTTARVNVTARVIGVVGNVSYQGLAAPAAPTVYVPFAQQPWSTGFLVVRTSGEPTAVAAGLRQAIGAVDRQIGVLSVRALDEVLADETAQPRFRTAVLAAVAGLAVALSAIGLSGVVAYSVSTRTAEIGVRVALGAAPRDVLWMVLREGMLLGAIGVGIGLVASFWLTRLLSSFVFGVAPEDPLAFGLAAGLLMLVVLAASSVPARRACRIDPIAALRAE